MCKLIANYNTTQGTDTASTTCGAAASPARRTPHSWSRRRRITSASDSQYHLLLLQLPDLCSLKCYRIYHFRSSSRSLTGFSGIHACPGRFFAANEVKIALIFTLLNYDWKLPEGVKPKIGEFGVALTTDATMQVLVRRREDDFDLSAIE